MSFNIRHKTLAYVPKATASLSLIGSIWIIVDIIQIRRTKKDDKMYHNLMLGMSISDLLASMALFFSTWPIPRGETVFGALGNITTCNVQGFFVQLGVATPIYNALLALYYLKIINYNWKEHQFRGMEKYVHLFSWTIALGSAITCMFLEQYNNANLWCWIAPHPHTCLNSIENNGITTCIRGNNAWVYRLFFYYIWLWLAVLIVTISSGLIMFHVFAQIKKLKKFNTHGVSNVILSSSQRHVRSVAIQSSLYVGAFFITAIFPSVQRMIQAKFNCTTTYFPLSLLTTTFFPLQGFWNFIIYIRPRVIRQYRRYKSSTTSSPVSSSSSPIPSFFDRRGATVEAAKSEINNTTTDTTTSTIGGVPVPATAENTTPEMGPEETENVSERPSSFFLSSPTTGQVVPNDEEDRNDVE